MLLHKANAGHVSAGGLCSEREMRIGLTIRQPLIEDGCRQSKRRDGGSNRCWWQSRGGGCLFGGRIKKARYDRGLLDGLPDPELEPGAREVSAGLLGLAGAHYQPLEVEAFRIGGADGVIGCLGQEFQDLGIAAGIEGRIGHYLLEQALLHQAGAGVGQEHATRRQQLEGQHVDVLVAATGAQQLGLALGKLGRIQHDDIELL